MSSTEGFRWKRLQYARCSVRSNHSAASADFCVPRRWACQLTDRDCQDATHAMSACTVSKRMDSHVPHTQQNGCIGRKPCVARTGVACGHGSVGDELED